VVPGSPGANDNASAVAVCLELLRRRSSSAGDSPALSAFFFDEEERNLRGSRTFLATHGVGRLRALFNMELVGMGDRFATWPSAVSEDGVALRAFEAAAAETGTTSTRVDALVGTTADHAPFRERGLTEAFTITCISGADLAVAEEYRLAAGRGVYREEVQQIMSQAPLFRHYHQATDTSDHLSEESLRLTADVVERAILAVNRRSDATTYHKSLLRG
jgi:Zn-dependent M28 family amino/carboxypeptidase